ncbi:MAG: exonuclease domain-containing protein [Candidatus Paceibacterota bacterium]
MNYFFLDTETTGNDLEKDRLTQVCYKMGEQTVNELFKPPVPISVKSMSITHITNKHVADKPPFINSKTFSDLKKILPETIMVAHNAPFDIAMLVAEGLSVPHSIDTLRVARYLDTDGVIPEYNLQFLRYYLDLDVPNAQAHDAFGDVLVLEAVFDRLMKKIRANTKTDDEALLEMKRISDTPLLMKKFNFGKHKDKTVEEVAQSAPDYLEWLLKQKLTAGEDDDWVYTLKHYLKK